jgi:hypothetical protein
LVVEKIAGALLILIGNFFLLYKGSKFELDKYVLIAIMATLAFATAISIDIGISIGTDLRHPQLDIMI